MKNPNEHFKQFHDVLQGQIKGLSDKRKSRSKKEIPLLEVQREQIEALVALENDFKLALISNKQGVKVYQKFVDHIVCVRRNILDARPFFRERQEVFTAEISGALREQRPRALYKYRFNFRFVQFALDAVAWKDGSKVVRIANKIKKLRNEIVVLNAPLAVGRARMFFNKTPKSHLEHMDLVQIAAEGLLSAVDKFVLPFTRAFRAVIIGRCLGNMIQNYSETVIHFYPREKRELYRALKWVGKNADTTDFEAMAEFVNSVPVKNQPQAQEQTHKATASKMANLLAAASVVSADSVSEEDQGHTGVSTRTIERYAAPVESQPDYIVEHEDAYAKLRIAGRGLNQRQKKLLLLRGISENSL